MPWPAIMKRYERVVTPVARRLAGRVGSLADLEHVGRKTGIVRHTPVRSFRKGDVVVIGANFGAKANWVRNVLAAQRAVLTLRGETLELGQPRLVPLAEASQHLPACFGLGLRFVVRTEHCVVLTIIDSGRS